MILLFRLVIMIILFMNFRISSNKLNINFVFKIFIDIKRISFFLVKLIRGIVLFLFLNYNRYMYYRVGLRINYGYVFIYAFSLVFVL
jgi:hypothetical protein